MNIEEIKQLIENKQFTQLKKELKEMKRKCRRVAAFFLPGHKF